MRNNEYLIYLNVVEHHIDYCKLVLVGTGSRVLAFSKSKYGKNN